MSLRPEDREHLVTLHAGPHFNFADVRQVFLELFQNSRAQFPVRHLAAAEPDRGLHFVAFSEPLARMLHAIAVIVLVGAGAKLNFLDDDDHLFLLGLVRLLLGQVLKSAKVDDLAHRRLGIRRDLNQIHAPFSRAPNGVARVHDSELFTVFGNYAHLGYANTFVNSYDRRTAETGTTAASKTCSYCCTSSVKSPEFRVWSFEIATAGNSNPETRNLKLCVSKSARLN